MLDFENMSGMVKSAYDLAKKAHYGQKDKAGKDYILHPMTVASGVGDDEYTIVVALLHDVIEDTDVRIENIEKSFPKDISDALECMTHRKGEPYMDYIKRVKSNKIAINVKLSDLRHNMDLSRFEKVSEKDINRVEKKYKPALEYLLS